MSHTTGLCSAAGCREGIYPHHEPNVCACGRPICQACWADKIQQCTRCWTRERWRESHDLYMPLLKEAAAVGLHRLDLLTQALEILPASDLRREIMAEIKNSAPKTAQEATKTGEPIG